MAGWCHRAGATLTWLQASPLDSSTLQIQGLSACPCPSCRRCRRWTWLALRRRGQQCWLPPSLPAARPPPASAGQDTQRGRQRTDEATGTNRIAQRPAATTDACLLYTRPSTHALFHSTAGSSIRIWRVGPTWKTSMCMGVKMPSMPPSMMDTVEVWEGGECRQPGLNLQRNTHKLVCAHYMAPWRDRGLQLLAMQLHCQLTSHQGPGTHLPCRTASCAPRPGRGARCAGTP